jgi:hypothetical protein
VAGVVMAIGGDTQGELLKEKIKKKEIGLREVCQQKDGINK